LILNSVRDFTTAIALLRALLDPITLERILVYPASSRTVLTEDHAFNQVPDQAGRRVTRQDLYLQFTW
jgi:hypothetical protein